MRVSGSLRKTRSIRAAFWIPVVSLVFGGVAATQSSVEPPPPVAQPTVTGPPKESRSARGVIPLKPDMPANVAGSAMPRGVSGGVVIVSSLPTSPWPEETRRRAHIQGEFLQNQPVEEGKAHEPLPLPPATMFEPQLPAPDKGSAPDAGVNPSPSAPGGFVQQWTGLSDTGWIPPDTIHAVGPNHVVESTNSGFAIYTKFGTQVQGYTTFQSFLNKPAGWDGFMYDPRLVYDATHQKFVMLALGRDDTNIQSYFWIAVSQTSDPTAGWWIWRFNATDTSGASTAWLDYAGLSADSWGVYVTGNYFYFSGGFRGSNLWSINPDIFNGGSTNGWRFLDLRWPSSATAFGIQPAHPHSINGAATTFFVNTFSGSGSQVLLWKLSGDRTSSPTLTSVAIGTAGYEAINMNVDQPGSGTDIDGGDARVMNAVYSQSHVFFTLTDDVDNNGTSAGWLTVKLNVNSNANEWQHLLWGGAGRYYIYPAVTILGGSSADANLAVFGSWTRTVGGDQFASGLFKIYDNQPADTTGPFTSHSNGLAAYVALDDNGRNRWGDYSGAGYDWSCGHAWGAVEAADTLNNWRTTITARQFGTEPICPRMEVTVPNGGQVWNAGTNHSINWLRQGLNAANQVFAFYNNGTTNFQIAGPLATTASTFNWLVPGTPTSTGKIFVGSWNGSAYEASDWSDLNFTVTAPDLRVISPSVSATVLLPNQSFTANATANNQGNGSSNVGTTLRYYRSTDAVITTADTQIATDAIAVLGAGGSSPQSASVTAPAAAGNYWIGACVDAVAGESNTANQCSTGVMITVALPDLVISAIDAPASANPGSAVNVSNTVRNQGTIATGVGFRVGLYYSSDATCNTADTFLASRAVGALAAGATSAASTPVTIPAAAVPGTRYICAVADDLAQVAETNEANNTGTDSLTIVALVPTVNLKVNGLDATFPASVTTPGPVLLTLDMTPGSTPLDHYFAIVTGGAVLWVTSGGISTTPAPLATFTPVTLTNLTLINSASWSPGTTVFLWLMLDGATVVNQDIIQVNVTGSSPTR